ncbi:unnamed protein product [Periconia digitata]|uniref:Uncharacterized protein n=1 Tax=Periconia digitata TaxID=1303443 RepID=A0A9W4UN79_9PLEO|nr:unnamed protein product [Periconia digitata]
MGFLSKVVSIGRKVWKSVAGAAMRVRDWVLQHPRETTAIVLAVIIGIVIVIATPHILSAVGFTVGGVAAGSVAASIQSGIGLVTAGSTFAILQSAGAGGTGLAVVYAITAVVTAAGAVVASLWSKFRP